MKLSVLRNTRDSGTLHYRLCHHCQHQVIKRSISIDKQTQHHAWKQIFVQCGHNNNIKSQSDWYEADPKVILDAHARLILKKEFGGSFYRALSTLFSENEWFPWKFKFDRTPSNFWNNTQNQRKFFEVLAKEFDLKGLDNWYTVLNRRLVLEHGGSFIKRYNQSPIEALKASYPEHNWIPWKFENTKKGFWKDPKHHRQFFDWLGKEIGIVVLDDWYSKLSSEVILQHGGYFLVQHYKGSAIEALTTNYPEHNWVLWKFTNAKQGFWKSVENQREFFERLGKKLGVEHLDDWYQVGTNSVVLEYGGFFLNRKYNGSLFAALSSCYPEHNWVPWKFKHVSHNFWNKENLGRLLSDIAEKLSIQTLDDWYRVDVTQLLQCKALYAIQKNGGLYQVLKQQYPDHPWNSVKFQARKKVQRWLLVMAKKLFPNEEILEDYIHPKLSFISSKRPVQFDLFIPSRSIAFEYHGEQHFQEVKIFQPKRVYELRDQEKRTVCEKNQVVLIEVPFWWDRKKKSLEELITKQLQPNKALA